MTDVSVSCLVCKRDSEEIPLISFRYKDTGLWICPQHLPIPDLLEGVKEDMEGIMTKPMIWLIKRVMKVKKK